MTYPQGKRIYNKARRRFSGGLWFSGDNFAIDTLRIRGEDKGAFFFSFFFRDQEGGSWNYHIL